MTNITKLDWDSNFFGLRIYRADIFSTDELLKLLAHAKDLKADLTYIFSPIRLPEKSGHDVVLADQKVVFVKKLSPSLPAEEGHCIISVHKPSPRLRELALLSGTFSRFKTDKRLSKRFNDFYTLWFERSLNREIASEVFSFMIDDIEVGFVTISIVNMEGVIGLIAVDPSFQGRKIGSALLRQAESWCFSQGLKVLNVATQLDNKQACEFYTANHFEIKRVTYIYHYHNEYN